MKPAPPSLAALRALAVELVTMIDAMAAAPAQAPDRAAMIRAAAETAGLLDKPARLAALLAARHHDRDAPDDAVTHAARAFPSPPNLNAVVEALRVAKPSTVTTQDITRRFKCSRRQAQRIAARIGTRVGRRWRVPESRLSEPMSDVSDKSSSSP
jgi:ribonuclease D